MKHIGMATLGRDAELRRTPSGDAVANLSLAVNFYDKNAEGNRGTQWIDATLWGQRAESLVQYLTKGSRHCFTLSDMHLEFYDKNDGSTGVKLAARVDDVELGPKREGGGEGGSSAPRGGNISRPPAPASQGRAPAASPKPSSGFDDMDDDIPF